MYLLYIYWLIYSHIDERRWRTRGRKKRKNLYQVYNSVLSLFIDCLSILSSFLFSKLSDFLQLPYIYLLKRKRKTQISSYAISSFKNTKQARFGVFYVVWSLSYHTLHYFWIGLFVALYKPGWEHIGFIVDLYPGPLQATGLTVVHPLLPLALHCPSQPHAHPHGRFTCCFPEENYPDMVLWGFLSQELQVGTPIHEAGAAPIPTVQRWKKNELRHSLKSNPSAYQIRFLKSPRILLSPSPLSVQPDNTFSLSAPSNPNFCSYHPHCYLLFVLVADFVNCLVLCLNSEHNPTLYDRDGEASLLCL